MQSGRQENLTACQCTNVVYPLLPGGL